MNSRKILLSGIKPTGDLHIGNYFGAMQQFVAMQDKYESYIFAADFHSLTSVQDQKEMSRLTLNVMIDYLAVGLDPDKVVLFKQSDVPQVTELAWIFNCLTSVPRLMRAHAYKDAAARNKEINAGVFTYPMLMAADILIQGTDIVPVGHDQKQHVEIARDTAEKFNYVFGETFKIPTEITVENLKTVPGTDGRKMSKSYKNTIGLFAEPEEIKQAVMSIVTDSKKTGEPLDPENDNVFALHKLFSSKESLHDVEQKYKSGNIGYKESKEILNDAIQGFVRPFRQKRKELEENKDFVIEVLKKGGEQARQRAEEKMKDVRQKIGLIL